MSAFGANLREREIKQTLYSFHNEQISGLHEKPKGPLDLAGTRTRDRSLKDLE